ncbi:MULTISPECIES: ABC transporter ATP-binding protein [unclassified Niallia]|uniref:ABC transporter ATP-binding protein n=1 Tax=Niallia TaxID=2837506 RepID=UPI001EDBE734|nr:MULTISPECIES: ABC transporter ATP-binding protein [unclassified Niallia]MDL0435323.1 ABC transporter ATP-binding protein [Niallia sp. SS-2023]UPO87518.1 ABC transporter ATP-binding protein [Niallia sp. Man26]
MAEKPVVAIHKLSKAFGKRPVLENINLEVQQGEILGLLGPSGAGKTTLVKAMIGLETPSSGSVTALETAMPNLKIMEKIGYMTQADALYHDLTALENLQFFARLYGLKKAQRKERIEEAAHLVNLTEHLHKTVSQYSGGMKRRLSICIALLNKPQLLILDEPTVGIDPVLRKSIWETFRSLKDSGTSIIVTTHVMDEAEKCDRLGMIRNGRIIALGSPDELMARCNARTMEEAFLYFGGVNDEN